MSDNTFKRDLAVGKAVELKHLDMIKKSYPDAHMIDGYCKEWDIYIPSEGFGVEIKSDQMSKYTGNLVVEIEFDGKPSALSTTKAKYWIFYTGEKSILVEVEDLKKLVSKLKTVRFMAKGDNKYKQAYLVKQHMIEDIGHDFK